MKLSNVESAALLLNFAAKDLKEGKTEAAKGWIEGALYELKEAENEEEEYENEANAPLADWLD